MARVLAGASGLYTDLGIRKNGFDSPTLRYRRFFANWTRTSLAHVFAAEASKIAFSSAVSRMENTLSRFWPSI